MVPDRFFGTGVVSLVLMIGAVTGMQGVEMSLVAAAGLLYLAGNIGVTDVCNVPLNNELDAANPSSTNAVAVWERYCQIWTRWNHLRTVTCLYSAVLFTLAL